MGLLEKLETAVRNNDKKTFINTIYDLTTDDIVSLTEDEFNSIFKISEQIEIKNVDEFYDDLERQGLFYLKNAMNGLDELNNALIGRFYFGLYVSLYQKYNEKFASALMHKGVACCLLSNLGIKDVQNLESAVELYQKAQKLFAPGSASYARALGNEGNARQTLAERGIDTQTNLESAVELYQKAQKLFVPGSTSYAGALTNEGNARRILAERGIDTQTNLESAIELYQKAQTLFAPGSTSYAGALGNEGTARQTLAERGIDTQTNLESAVELYQKAQKLFVPGSTDYALVLMNEGNARRKLAESGIDMQTNLESAVELYQKAQKLFAPGSTNYALVLMNEGTARQTLAERGIDTQTNLESAVELYQKAQKLFASGSADYALVLMNEGTARQTLAERGIDTQTNLESARELYIQSISILEKLKDGGTYSIALLNLNQSFIYNFRKSGNRSYLEEAKKILEDAELKIKDREVWDKELILSKLHEIRANLLEFEGKSGINNAAREYNKAFELTGNPFYRFMDEFSLARIDIDKNAFCSIVEDWKRIEKTGIFLDNYEYSIFECHLRKAFASKGISREEEFKSALKKLEEIRDRTQIKIIKDRVSAYVYIMNALVDCFRRDRYEEAKKNIRSACKIFHEYDDKAGKKTCDLFIEAIHHDKSPEAWMEIIRQENWLSCNLYRLLSEGAYRKIQVLHERPGPIEEKIDNLSTKMDDISTKIDHLRNELNAGFERIKNSIKQEFEKESEHSQVLINRIDEMQQKIEELIGISKKVDEKEGESIRQFSKKIQQMLEKGDSDGLKRFVEFIINSEGSFLNTIAQANISEKDKEEAKEKLKGSLSGFKGIHDKVKKEAVIFGRHVTYHIAAALMAEEIIKHIFPLISTAVIGIPVPSQVLDALTKVIEKKQYPPLQPM